MTGEAKGPSVTGSTSHVEIPYVGACRAVDLDRAADQLYAFPPGEFVAARGTMAAAARAGGDAGLAEAIKKLRKPTVSAWLANQLVRERPGEVHRLLETGSGLRAAQEQLAGDRIRELSRRRREVVTALSRAAQVIGDRAGVSLSDATADELEGTLEAALADPTAGDALRHGRLTSALRYAGTGFGNTLPAITPGATAGRDRRPSEDATAAHRSAVAVRHAESAAKTASRKVAGARERVARLDQQLGSLRSILERAKSEVERLEHEAGALEQRAAAALRQLRDAEAQEQSFERRLAQLRGDRPDS